MGWAVVSSLARLWIFRYPPPASRTLGPFNFHQWWKLDRPGLQICHSRPFFMACQNQNRGQPVRTQNRPVLLRT